MGLYHHAPVGVKAGKAAADSIELRRESMGELRLMIGYSVTPTDDQVRSINRCVLFLCSPNCTILCIPPTNRQPIDDQVPKAQSKAMPYIDCDCIVR